MQSRAHHAIFAVAANDGAHSFSLLEGSLATSLWYGRVPSKSNPADLPSRLLCQEACSRFGADFKRDIACASVIQDFLLADSCCSRLAKALTEPLSFEVGLLSAA